MDNNRTNAASGQPPGWTYIVAVEGVEDSGYVAAEDADGNAGVIQSHPAAAGLFWAMAAEEVVTHRTQHTQLKKEEASQAAEDVRKPKQEETLLLRKPRNITDTEPFG